MSTIDYIRITGILEFNTDSEFLDITYNIEHSADQDFAKSKIGVITLRLSEILNIEGFHNNEIEVIASKLIEQVLVRERDKERTLRILHSEGIELDEWLISNTPFLKQ